MKTFKVSSRKIGEGCEPLIVAEIGINHNGKLDEAFKLVDAAQKAGNDWADNVVKKEPDNKWFKKMLNHQRQFQMDMSVYSKMRFQPGSRTAKNIGPILK